VEAVTRHLHVYVNLARERDIPCIGIYTCPGYSGTGFAIALATTGSVQQILSWSQIERLSAADDDMHDDALQEVIEPFGCLGNFEEHGDI
jgi:hypothetical protein